MIIVSDNPVLIDTSVWIDYFRRNPVVHGQVEKLIEERRIGTCRFIVAELLQGARSEEHYSILKETTEVFKLFEETPETWLKAAYVSSQLIRMGKKVGLGDCYIAVLAHQYDIPLWSFDKHFKVIRSVLKFNLYK